MLGEGVEPWEEVAARARVSPAQARLLAQALHDAGYPLILRELGVGLAPGSPAPQFLLPRLKGRFGRPYRY
ncbi:MAG: bifunctional biotin--[acetyl-CoA-carboxylase] synthetase/biotin operon repressor, partial [Candidatus Bipolaricaulaceae bacterium]